ncbi:MAG: cytidylyltransferase domain-containing protein [Phycisphaerae bacterium]
MVRSVLEPAVFVQARMTSRRLPGKVMLEVAGQPVLAYLLERLAHCQRTSMVVVLTSRDPSDDAVADFCQRQGLECFRGDLHNVAKRFAAALDHYGLERFVRISGDSPLLDQAIVNQCVDVFSTGEHDLVTNVFPRSYPTGQSVEVVSAAAFRRALLKMSKSSHFEHVTPYFYENHEAFRIFNLSTTAQLREIRLSVDTRADYEVFCRIVGLMQKPHWQYSLSEVVELYQRVVAQADSAALT